MFDTSKVKSSAVAALIALAALFSFSSGAALPGAAVTARNAATGVESKTTATNEGVYSIPRILPGKYNVAAEAPGFKKTEVTDIEVSVGKDTVIDIKLETGAISEIVNVTSGSAAVSVADDQRVQPPELRHSEQHRAR